MTTEKDVSNAASILGTIGGKKRSPLKTLKCRENGEYSFPYRIYMPAAHMIPPRFRTLLAAEKANVGNGVIQRLDPETGEWKDMEKG